MHFITCFRRILSFGILARPAALLACRIASLPTRTLTHLAALLAIFIASLPIISNQSLAPAQIATAAPAFQGDDHFGVVWINPPSGLVSNDRVRQAVDMGARWDRFPFYWNEMQPNQGGNIDYGKTDAFVAADVAGGVQVQGILLGAPQWAIVGGKVNSDAWYQFVYQTAQRYASKIDYWEIWNEPDLLDGTGKGVYWWASVEDYYDLLKTAYRAVKAADPSAKVLMSALAFPYNNQDFFGKFLDVVARDSSAPGNNYYFDIVPLHLYGRASTIFDVPIGFIGQPDFAGFRKLMQDHGFVKPIWINEAGVPVWDSGSGKKAPGRATADEQASYIIQAFGYALASGVDKVFIFQLYDDGAGAIDPSTKQPAEYFGLISNAGVTRPAYTAYQVAAKYFSGAKLATRVNLWRTGEPNIKGVDLITLYGTPQGKITLAWNYDGSVARQVQVQAARLNAILMDKLGHQSQVSANNGTYTLDAPAATNNNNFGCFTSAGCNPNDYIIGGNPSILIEADNSVPPATINALPSGVRAPFTVSWSATRVLNNVVKYDVQYMDQAVGTWQDWLKDTTAMSATFGGNDMPVRRNHTYIFRVRAKDVNGNLLDGIDYPGNGMASTVVLGGSALAEGADTPKDAKIEIVWPQGNKPVTEATLVNIAAYVFQQGTLTSVQPSWPQSLKLFRSLNNGVEEQVSVGQKRVASQGGLSYPVWDFNDIDVSQARDPLNKYYFRLAADNVSSLSNIWSHSADARTNFPKTDVPTAVASDGITNVDAKIEIVWPQGNLPVDKATKANIGVYLFQKGTLNAVPLSFNQNVHLWRAINNDAAREVGMGTKDNKSENGVTYPVWLFNDVDVSAAQNPANKIYFSVTVDGVSSASNIWSHGKDARTYFPAPDQPVGVSTN